MTNSHSKKLHCEKSGVETIRIPATLRTRKTCVRQVPVTSGICLRKGRLSDATAGLVEGFCDPVSAQFDVLNRWSDGSIRWVRASFIAPETDSGLRELQIVFDSVAPTPIDGCEFAAVTTLKWRDDEILIRTRNLTGDPPREQTLRLSICLCDVDGVPLKLRCDVIREESTGPVRQVFLVTARVATSPFVTLQFRLTWWPAAGLLHVETRMRNTRRAKHAGGLWDLGDAGSFLFGSLEAGVCSDEIPASATTRWKAEPDLTPHESHAEIFLYQFGSGGQWWNSTNHINADGVVPVKTRGYEVRCESGTLRGYRAEPAFLVQGDSSYLGLAVPEFWQQFPGSVAAARGTLEVGLFPAIRSVIHELQGGEQKTQSFWLSVNHGSGSVNQLDWVYDNPRLLQTAESFADADVFPWFCGPVLGSTMTFQTRESNAEGEIPDTERFLSYVQAATSGRFSLDARREAIDEFGWRNFGDLPADHEQTHYAGAKTIISHYNNQFDLIYGAIQQLAATGDACWFDWLDPLARHVMDIDIYHTSEDRAAFNGGLFWHTDHYIDARTCTHRTYSRHNQQKGQPCGGGPGCEHNYTTGLLHYYFLTGHAEARDSVLSLAEWVIHMDDGRQSIFSLFDDGPTGLASSTVFENFHGPGRGAGNSINALLDGWLLTGSDRYLIKLEELIRRCVHPSQSPDDLHLLDAEHHWSYTVFLYSLGRYLLAKAEAEQFDSMYSYARDVMQTYGRWMARKERRTLDHPEDLRYPTEAWAAQDFRKANILRIAASCEDNKQDAAAMRERARIISDAAWRDLNAFGDARLNARCLSILMTEGHRDVFHRLFEPTPIPRGKAVYDDTEWTMFVPQKERVKRMLKSPVGLLRASVRGLRAKRLVSAWKCLRRYL